MPRGINDQDPTKDPSPPVYSTPQKNSLPQASNEPVEPTVAPKIKDPREK